MQFYHACRNHYLQRIANIAALPVIDIEETICYAI